MTTALAAAGAGAAGLFKPSRRKLLQTARREKTRPGPVSSRRDGPVLLPWPAPAHEVPATRPGPKDVAIELQFCGVCHSDIHHGREDWRKETFPLITGHELAGVVVAVGSSVSKFKVGSRVGVGCMVNSCRHCGPCEAGMEQYCENGTVLTYGSKDRDGSMTRAATRPSTSWTRTSSSTSPTSSISRTGGG